MKLASFLSEVKDSLKHIDPEIDSALSEIEKQLKKVGLSSKPYQNDEGYPFKDDDTEAMSYFTDGILEFVILVNVYDQARPDGTNDKRYSLVMQLILKSKYSTNGKEISIGSVSLKGLERPVVIESLKHGLEQLKKLDSFFDWILDVTGKFKGIKFKAVTGISSSSDNSKLNFPTSLAAVGGEFNFYPSSGNPHENVY